MNVTIIVGGDVGRSGRSVHHALAFAGHGEHVDLVGFADSPLQGALERSPDIVLRPVRSFEWLRGKGLFFYPFAALRQIALAIQMAWWVRRTRADVILIQNPPAFPALPVALFASRRARVVVDWHNVTASMLQQRSGSNRLVRLVGRLEIRLARLATAHLAVSNALRTFLRERGIEATTLHDVPLRRSHAEPRRDDGWVTIMVPSSWGIDDDFTILEECARSLDSLEGIPGFRFVLTGKGARRESQMARFRALDLHHVQIDSEWYAPGEYEAALASADIGLSLHRSTSGLDLPLKVVDMLGCGLPSLVLDYGPALREQVDEASGARFFSNANELTRLLTDLAHGWPDATRLAELRAGTRNAFPRLWDEEWSAIAEPMFRSIKESSTTR